MPTITGLVPIISVFGNSSAASGPTQRELPSRPRVVNATPLSARQARVVARSATRKLAAAIEYLAAQPDLCRRLAQGGFRRFQNGNSTAALGKKLVAVLTAVAGGEIDDANAGPQMELSQR